MPQEAGDGSAGRRNRRAAILAAATEVFAEQGYEGASLREVGERAGVVKGHLTYYFARKDDLLFAVVDALHDRFVALAQGWPARPTSAFAALESAAREHVLLVCDQTAATRVSYENFRHLSGERQATVLFKRDAYEKSLRSLVRAACRPAGKSPASAGLTTRLLLGTLNWPYTWWHPGGRISASALADHVASVGLADLRPSGAT